MTSWRTVWPYDVFWRHNELFGGMTNFLTSLCIFYVMTNLLDVIACFTKFLTSWRVSFWRHDVFVTPWRTFWSYDVFLTPWPTFDVMTCFWRHDEPFGAMTCFWHHDELLDVMTGFWCYDVFFYVMRIFDKPLTLKRLWHLDAPLKYVMTDLGRTWRSFWRDGVLFYVMTYFLT